MNRPHEPSDACLGVHCYSCHLDEPSKPSYIICGECGHVYRSAGELRRAYRKVAWQVHQNTQRWTTPAAFRGPTTIEVVWRILTVRAKTIRFCQHCVHDF